MRLYTSLIGSNTYNYQLLKIFTNIKNINLRNSSLLIPHVYFQYLFTSKYQIYPVIYFGIFYLCLMIVFTLLTKIHVIEIDSIIMRTIPSLYEPHQFIAIQLLDAPRRKFYFLPPISYSIPCDANNAYRGAELLHYSIDRNLTSKGSGVILVDKSLCPGTGYKWN